MSDPSSQPTQPLTDEDLAAIREDYRGVDEYDSVPRLLAEVDRLRAELDSMTRFAEDLREERDRRLRSEGERGVERDALAAKIEATAELHPVWFCETCNSPGPCLTRLRLGLDQDGSGKGDPAETPHPDRPCPHEEFAALVAVNRIRADDDDATVVGYSADIKVDCQDCGEPFRWVGVDAGASPRGPMCSIDETELRAPLRPASADPDFGLGLPGFAVRANQSRDGGESHG